MRFLFKLLEKRFEEYQLDEFVYSLPDTVTDPALRVMSDHARKFERLIVYMAYQIHRKMAADTKNTERYQGMLIGLKTLNTMVASLPKTEATSTPKPEEKSTLDKALEGVSAFVLSTPTSGSDT